jgi:hypothetical protein
MNQNAEEFVCITPSTLAYSYYTGLPAGANPKRITATDMNNDGYSDFFFGSYYNGSETGAALCIYKNHTSSLNCTIIGGAADYIYGVDVDNDNKRDIVYSDSANDRFKVWTTRGIPASPCDGIVCEDKCDSGNLLTNGTCYVNGSNYICGYDFQACPNGCANASCVGGGFCSDTDSSGTPPSDSPQQYGVLTTTLGFNANDTCYGNMLTEWYCTNFYNPQAYNYKIYNCTALGGSCVNGACLINGSGTCTDTDSVPYPTRNYYMKGITSVNITGLIRTATDICLNDGTTLIESYCTAANVPLIYNISYSCPTESKVCQNGICRAACSADSCSDPCIYKDTFGYNCTLKAMGWSLYSPDNSLMPDSNKMCNNDSENKDFIHNANPGVYYDAATEEFDINIPNITDAMADISMRYYDSTEREFKTLYQFSFYVQAPYGFIVGGYSTTEDGEKITGVSFPVLPSGIFDPGTNAHIKVIHYNFDTYGRTFLNTTTNLSQPYLPNTYSIIVNNDPSRSYFNIPQYEPLVKRNSNMMNSVIITLSNATCVDNLQIYGGTNIDEFDLEPEPLINVSEISGCWNTKTGEFACWVAGCQDCCEILPNNEIRVKDFGCTLRKTAGHWVDGIKGWILDNLITFILVLVILILVIPILLRAIEIIRGFGGNRGY